MTYADVLDVVMTRCERLGFVAGAEQKADAAELELYIYLALLDIADMVDVPALMQRDDNIALTTAGKPDYPLPESFGRLLLPRPNNRRGMYLWDTLKNNDLEYIDPNSFMRARSLTQGKPAQFSVIERTLWLSPAPDGNGSSGYTVRGTYIQSLARPELGDTVTLGYPAALIEQTLYLLASDVGKLTPGLEKSRDESLARLTQGSR